MRTTPKSLGLTYVTAEHRWVGQIADADVPANHTIADDAHGKPQQFWDIGTVANWWRVRRDISTGIVSVSRVTFP